MNTNTFRGVLDYLTLTKKSTTINSWLLGINSAILLFLINNLLQPTDVFKLLVTSNIYFKIVYFILFIWLSLNVIVLIMYSYREKVLSLTIEDKYYRLKSFISYMDNIKKISEEELLDTDMFKVSELTVSESTRVVLDEYVGEIIRYSQSILKWSNKRLLIYKFIILASIPLLIACLIVAFSYL
ncbi:hypothetical protein ES676_01345 [Bizionia saleffrena]|uniref:Uncharacterized protein n=1 Tax=Bizionia saleffrena TaxID=291189 RepID=A0A8H2LFW9_9FLAO|nr:hypothetical protein [Bizionia saleffrena]TYB80340.1 hypothetical protein ES676_01345 [Bizionia saleffrena]